MRKLSKKNAKALLLRVARHIARFPHLYDFWSHGDGCKQACMLERARRFAGFRNGDLCYTAEKLGFGTASNFYHTFIRTADPTNMSYKIGREKPKRVAEVLREMAGAL